MARLVLIGPLLLFSNIVFAAEAVPPNLVVFLVDDLGWQDTSVSFWTERTPQNEHFQTPAVNRLSELGVRFSNAYACTVCSPSRTSLMTGWNAARHRVTNWTLYPDRETSGVTPRLRAPDQWRKAGLQPDVMTLPKILSTQLGYRTIHIGKAHWGAFDTAGSDPLALGFDVNVAGHAAGAPGHYHGRNNFGNSETGEHQRPWGVPGLSQYHATEIHLTDALTEEATREISESVANGQPFFLYLAHYAVHAPIQPHQRMIDSDAQPKYANGNLDIPVQEVNYASMVAGIDDSLSRVLQQLHAEGVANNTLVVFASDNGGLSRHARGTTPRGTGRDTHSWPLREGKGSAYEGGTRIPLIVAWAQHDANSSNQKRIPVAAGSVVDTPVIIEDLAPTLLTWAGGSRFVDELTDCDGIDFTPALRSDSDFADSAKQRPLVFHYPHQWTGAVEGGYQPHSAIRIGDWKAIYFYEGERWELYDLQQDIRELHNRSDSEPRTLSRLADTLQTLLRQRHATWPVNRATGIEEPLRVPSQIIFPQADWQTVAPEQAGLSEGRLEQIRAYLGGRGMITFDGRKVYQWGDISQPADVASACKPVYTHLLLHALSTHKLASLETLVAKYQPGLKFLNRTLGFKDQAITFRHCANQTSCYGVAETPGEAFDYNDYQMALFFDTLVEKVYGVSVTDVDAELLRPVISDVLGCQDNPSLLAFGDGDRAGRLRISPRDFCRFGLLYMHEGNWRGKVAVVPELARTVTRSPLPNSLPRTAARSAEMLADQRSIGSKQIPDDQTDHLGSYSWAWWVNGQRRSGARLWPAAPDEVFACLGHKHGKRGMAVIPAWRIVMSWNDTKLDQRSWADPQRDAHPLNEVFRLLQPSRR